MNSLTPTTSRQPDHPIDSIFVERWSPRAFLDKDVPDNILLGLFEAARWAPSAFNYQPWRFIVMRTDEEKSALYPCISENNLAWCKKSPVLVMIISEQLREGIPNRSHAFDTGAAWGHLALAATMQGLATHPMTGFNFDQAREILQIPDEFAIQALVAIGYRGPADELPDALREREFPKGRRPIAESIFSGSFGKSFNR